MRLLIALLLTGYSVSSPAAVECWRFRDVTDPKSELRSLTLEIQPARGKGDSFHMGKITALRSPGKPITGQMPCHKLTPTRWRCEIQDDGGSFVVNVNGDGAELSTTYLLLGDQKDSLEFASDDREPWLLEGKSCALSSSRKR